MKRDISFVKKYIILWFAAFGFAALALFIFILLLSVICLLTELSENTVRILLLIAISFSAGLCACLFCRFAKIKGIIAGLISGGVLSFGKLALSLFNDGVGKENFLVYICIIATALVGGIMAANRKSKKRNDLVKINKTKFF